MKYLLVSIPLWLLSTSCHSTEQGEAANIPTESIQSAQSNHQMKETITQEKLQQLSSDEAIKKLGSPGSQDSFEMDDRLPEFRVELYNYYKEKEYKGRHIRLKELTWPLNDDENITAWYPEASGQKPVHTMVWAKHSEF